LVLRSLQEAQNKLKEAEASLLTAKNNFQLAKEKAEEIRNQSVLLSSQTKKSLLLEIEDDIKRLQSSGLAVIRLEEEKSVSEMLRL
jgi:F0F1-type ATP synthase membrane subunit b/b'